MILANTQKGFAHDYLLFISFVLNQIKVCYNLIRRSCESIDLVYLEFDWLNDLGSRYPFLVMLLLNYPPRVRVCVGRRAAR